MGKSRFQKKGKKAVQVLVTWGPRCGTICQPTLGKQPLEEFSKLKSKTGYGRKSPVFKSENPKNHFVVPIVTRSSPRKATKLNKFMVVSKPETKCGSELVLILSHISITIADITV